MLVNRNYNFLFVHIQKTAGTSIIKTLQSVQGNKNFRYGHSFYNDQVPEFENYFKFCFVRNPWDRLYSWYNMTKSKGSINNFSSYLLNKSKNFSEFLDCTEIILESSKLEWDRKIDYPKSISFNQLDYVSDKHGNILVDYIGRFENIQHDFSEVTKKIGLPELNLLHLNKFNHDNYRKYYTDKDIEKVALMYKKDIEYFKYEF